MKQGNPVVEDMFEKAREAFFGTARTPATVVSSVKVGPAIQSSAKEATAPFLAQRETAEQLVPVLVK